MRKILVLGSGGAGKTTLTKLLSEKTGLPVIHLDSHYWKPGWMETPKEDWLPRVIELSQRPEWIMDGNYSGTIDIRMKYADTVIFLDFGRFICTLGVLKRLIRHQGSVRDEMPDGCRERFSLEFMRWIWNYSSRSRPRILSAMQKAPSFLTVYVIRNRRSLRRFLADV